MAKMFNRARMSVSSTGTGTLTLNGPVLGYQSFATAGVANGDTVSYVIEDGANFEFGTGTYTSAGTTLSRTVTQSYNGTTYGTSPISVTTSAQVFITALAADVAPSAAVLGMTTGSVPFVSSGTLAQNNSGLFWDNTNARLGIGTSSPSTKLHLSGTTTGLSIEATSTFASIEMGGPSGAYIDLKSPFSDDYDFRLATDGSTYAQLIAGGGMYLSLYSNNLERMRIDSSGRVGIGSSPNASTIGLTLGGTATGGTVIFQQYLNYTVASDVTAFARGIVTNINTIASAFTLSNLEHYYAGQGTIGAGSAITNQIGYRAAANLTGATNNYGFYGDLPSGTGRYNFYAAGTADNYFAGNVGFGSTSPRAPISFPNTTSTAGTPNRIRLFDDGSTNLYGFNISPGFLEIIAGTGGGVSFYTNGANERMRIDSAGLIGIASTTVANTQLQIGGTAPTAGTASYSINIQQTIPSGSTAVGVGYCTTLSTQAASFTCGGLIHFNASQATIGAGSTVTNQYGFIANSNITGATNNYAFYGNIPSGTGRWNFYAAGTADNYFAGNVGIGTNPTAPITVLANSGANTLYGIGRSSDGSAILNFYNNANTTQNGIILFADSSAEYRVRSYLQFTVASGATNAMRLDAVGNLLLGGTAARATTAGTAHLDLFNGTAPAGTLTNGISLYSSSGDFNFMDASGNGYQVGYRNIPQVGGAAKTGNYTAVLGDSGQMAVMNATTLTYTIPANSSVAYPVGTVLTIANIFAGNLSIAITTDTMTIAGTTTTGTRTLAQNGVATAIKITSTSWLISGSGLS